MFLTLYPPLAWELEDFRMEIKTGPSVVSLRIVPEVVVIAARTLPVVFPVEDYSARRKSALVGPQYSMTFI